MAREYQLIDSVAYPPSMKLPKDPLLSKVFGDTKFEGETVEQMVARMDECAIQASIITVNAAYTRAIPTVSSWPENRRCSVGCRL